MATPERLEELIGILVQRVRLTEDGAYEIEPVPRRGPSSIRVGQNLSPTLLAA